MTNITRPNRGGNQHRKTAFNSQFGGSANSLTIEARFEREGRIYLHALDKHEQALLPGLVDQRVIKRGRDLEGVYYELTQTQATVRPAVRVRKGAA